MTMTAGARLVAAGFAATGVARGADLFEQRVLGSALRVSSSASGNI
jgi:hypothetical protein